MENTTFRMKKTQLNISNYHTIISVEKFTILLKM